MSFGFSVGDIIAGATLCYDISKAISDGPKELDTARCSLRTLTSVLQRVNNDFGKLTDDETRKEELEEVMYGCWGTVKKFRKIVDKYSDVETGKRKRTMGLRALRWSLVDAKALPGIQAEIGRWLEALGMLMNAQQGTAIADSEVRAEARHLEMLEKLEEIKMAILAGNKDPTLLLPALDIHTGKTDISAIGEELISNGVAEEDVKDNAESIREYVEQHRDEVSSVAGLTQRDWDSERHTHYDSQSEYYAVPSAMSGTQTYVDTDNESIILRSEHQHGVPWNNKNYSNWLDKKEQLHRGIDPVEEEPPDPDRPVVASHTFCPLCLKVFPMRNLHDHVTKAHDQLSKERFLQALSRANDPAPGADVGRWTEIPLNHSGALPPESKTMEAQPVLEPGNTVPPDIAKVMSQLESLKFATPSGTWNDLETSLDEHEQLQQALSQDIISRRNAAPANENGENYKVACPACFTAVSPSELSAHLDTHDHHRELGDTTTATWKTLLAPMSGSIAELSPRNTAILLHHGASAADTIPPVDDPVRPTPAEDLVGLREPSTEAFERVRNPSGNRSEIYDFNTWRARMEENRDHPDFEKIFGMPYPGRRTIPAPDEAAAGGITKSTNSPKDPPNPSPLPPPNPPSDDQKKHKKLLDLMLEAGDIHELRKLLAQMDGKEKPAKSVSLPTSLGLAARAPVSAPGI